MVSKEKRIKVAVVGDLMADIYHYGRVNRISPEGPVAILTSKNSQSFKCCGGAANVAHQFMHLNADVTMFGFADRFMEDLPVDLSGCVNFGNVPQKHRFFSENQQIFRWDVEEIPAESNDLVLSREKVFEKFHKRCGEFDVVVLSNYAKGFFDHQLAKKIIDCCRDNNILTVCDPKVNLPWWTGCDVLKPNYDEAVRMTGEMDDISMCQKITDETHCRTVVITRAGAGVFGMTDGEFFEVKPDGKQKGVNSVIGAGDCFLAYLSAMLCRGENICNSCRIAFTAGSIYVQYKHNKPVSFVEIYRRLDPVGSKVVTRDELLSIRGESSACWVMTNGCFDILGSHHVKLLNFAKRQGDILVVAVNSDSSVKALKGDDRPINGLSQRMEVLANMECVDYVVSFEEDRPQSLVEKIVPNKIVKGDDYRKEDIAGHDVVGLENVILFPMIEGCSTTKTIEKCR